MSRDSRLYLEDILEACRKIESYVRDVTRQEFDTDSMLIDAVVRNLEIVGEAAKRIPVETKSDLEGAPWREAAALRDVLAHEYFGIDLDIVWDVVSNKLPPLCGEIHTYLEL